MRRLLTLVGLLALAGCSSIKEHRGYLADGLLYTGIRAGIDNQRSVEATLGRPTFTSQFGEPIWYYVSSTTGQRPFGRPRIEDQSVLAIRFDSAGNVLEVDRSGIERVVYLTPDSEETPTLGRERGRRTPLSRACRRFGGRRWKGPPRNQEIRGKL